MIPKILTTTYYDYTDIQKKLCEYMEIDESNFRVFEHPGRGWVVDYWSMFVHLFGPAGNDTHNTMFYLEAKHLAVETLLQEGHNQKDVDRFLSAVYKLFDEYGNEEQEIHYWLSW